MDESKPHRHYIASCLTEGQLVNRTWLKAKGFSRPDVDYYLRSGHLISVTRGLYRRPGPQLKWQHVLYSLQEMGHQVHVGGMAALTHQGFGHFVSMGSEHQIAVYSHEPIPAWLDSLHQDLQVDFRFSRHKVSWLHDLPDILINIQPFGDWDWPIRYGQPELAVLQLLQQVTSTIEFKRIDPLFENLATLSPQRLTAALSLCSNVKAKRLFGWYAERHTHAWFNSIDWNSVNLGSGKRLIIKGGTLSNRWDITVPREMEKSSENIEYGDEDGPEQFLF